MGVQMVMFAMDKPKLYRLLYMSEKPQAKSFEDVYNNLGKPAFQCVEVIQKEYDMNYDDAMLLFKHTWMFTYAVGALIATGTCHFTFDEVQDMLSREFVAMISLIKSGRANSCTTIPEKK